MEVPEIGSGPSVVFLHGQPGAGSDWRRVAALLSRDHHLLIPDRPGYGATGGSALGLFDNARLAAELIESRAHGPATVVGHSHGAAIALALASKWPARVSGLVLLAPAATGSAIGLFDRLLAAPGAGEVLSSAGYWALRCTSGAVAVASRRGAPGCRRLDCDGLDCNGLDDRPGTLSGWARTLSSWSAPAAWRSFLVEQRLLLGELPRLEASLGSVKAPAIVLVGTRDRVVPPAVSRDLAGRLRDAELREIAAPGHLLCLSAPAAVSAAVRSLSERGLDARAGPG